MTNDGDGLNLGMLLEKLGNLAHALFMALPESLGPGWKVNGGINLIGSVGTLLEHLGRGGRYRRKN